MVFTEGNPTDVGLNPEKLQDISTTLAHWVTTEKTPAICAFVARKGTIDLHEAHGVHNAELGTPTLTTDAIFPLASLTKPLTAACVVLLMDDGLIDGFSKVHRIIPEFSGPKKDDVNIHHLLTHTPGIDDETVWQFTDDSSDAPPVPNNQHPQIHHYLQKIYACPQEREPGHLMTYCNAGYDLLAEIVRRMSGTNIADFARERLFDPLGMTSTSYSVPDDQLPRIVRRKDSDPNGAWLNTPESPKNPSGAGGGYSTVYDMSVFAQMLLNNGTYNGTRMFSPRAVDLMTQD
jgi:CubicO group peptidase (beta-lactamase class C family)